MHWLFGTHAQVVQVLDGSVIHPAIQLIMQYLARIRLGFRSM